MSQALAPVVWTLAGVLAVAGAAKLRDPEPTRLALRSIGMPSGTLVVRIAGVSELGIAAWSLLAPSTAAMAALAAAYMGFAGAISRLRQAGASDCGCFGSNSFEPTAAHLVLNLCAAAVASVAVLTPPPAIDSVTGRAPLEAIALGAGVLCCVCLCVLVFTTLPRTWSAYGAER